MVRFVCNGTSVHHLQHKERQELEERLRREREEKELEWQRIQREKERKHQDSDPRLRVSRTNYKWMNKKL